MVDFRVLRSGLTPGVDRRTPEEIGVVRRFPESEVTAGVLVVNFSAGYRTGEEDLVLRMGEVV